MSTITTTYSVGDIAYFIITGTADIVPVRVVGIHLNSILSNDVVSYDLITSHFDGLPTKLQFVGQSQLFTFEQAKSALLSYLNQQITLVTGMTIPPVI